MNFYVWRKLVFIPLLALLLLGGANFILLTSWADTPAPLPPDCGSTLPGDELGVCCLRGYVAHLGQVVSGATISIQSDTGHVVTTTQIFEGLETPYYRLSLSQEPLNLTPGEVVTITASYEGYSHTVRHIVQPGAQQVDLTTALYRNVLPSHPHYQHIEAIIETGALSESWTLGPDLPLTATVLRADIAEIFLRLRHYLETGESGLDYEPPPAQEQIFSDVPLSHPKVAWINEFYRQGGTQGGNSGDAVGFFPDRPPGSDEIILFLLRWLESPSYFDTLLPVQGIYEGGWVRDTLVWPAAEDLYWRGIGPPLPTCRPGYHCYNGTLLETIILLSQAFIPANQPTPTERIGDFCFSTAEAYSLTLTTGRQSIQPEDVVCYHRAIDAYKLFFNGSVHGITANIDAFTINQADEFWFSLSQSATLTNVIAGQVVATVSVTPSNVIHYNPRLQQDVSSVNFDLPQNYQFEHAIKAMDYQWFDLMYISPTTNTQYIDNNNNLFTARANDVIVAQPDNNRFLPYFIGDEIPVPAPVNGVTVMSELSDEAEVYLTFAEAFCLPGQGTLGQCYHPGDVLRFTGRLDNSTDIEGQFGPEPCFSASDLPGLGELIPNIDAIHVNEDLGCLPPTASIVQVTPATPNLGDTIEFVGQGADPDESGHAIVSYRWRTLTRTLSTQASFNLRAVELGAGTHQLYFEVQDDDGDWSAPDVYQLAIMTGTAEVKSLILVNSQVISQHYGPSEALTLRQSLSELATDPAVQGQVVYLEDDPAVATAYAFWQANPTSVSAANATAEAIHSLILGLWDDYPALENVVLVGDDRALPFYRIEDDTPYPQDRYPFVDRNTPIGAAFAANYYLSDDYYGTRHPTQPPHAQWPANQPLYVPELAVGRLVETPSDIIGQVDSFLGRDTLTFNEAVVTGYDFVEDGANEVCRILRLDGIFTRCEFVGPVWERNNFYEAVFNQPADMAFIGGHGDHFRLGTPRGDFVTAQDVTAAAGNRERILFYSMACHTGLNVAGTRRHPLDFPEVMARERSIFIGNTGYGWGFVNAVGLTEQLMAEFSRYITQNSADTVGQALLEAKRNYYLSQSEFDVYDGKIMHITTLYGLPMYRYSTPFSTRQPAEPPQAQVEISRRANDLIVIGRDYANIGQADLISTTHGDYYSFKGETHISHERPVQPQLVAEADFYDTPVRGVLLNSARYRVENNFNPLIERAITETEVLAFEEPPITFGNWYPARLAHVNRLGDAESLVMILGQYNAETSQARVYQDFKVTLLYHQDNLDVSPPEITVTHRLSGPQVAVTVQAFDASGIETAWLTYDDGQTGWYSLPLTPINHSNAVSDSVGLWQGQIPLSQAKAFFIQVADKVGNVSVADNGGRYYWPGQAVYLPLVLR